MSIIFKILLRQKISCTKAVKCFLMRLVFEKSDWDIATTFIVWCAMVWVWMKATGLPNGKWVLFLTLWTSASSYFLS